MLPLHYCVCASRLVDRHAAGLLSLDVDIGKVNGGRIGVILSCLNNKVALKPLSKVPHTDNAVGDCQEDEENGDDGESGERLLDSGVVLSPRVDSDELEDEVCESTVVEDDDGDHTGLIFLASEEGGTRENEDSDRDGDNCQGEFGVAGIGDDDHELDNETQEEEEIKLQQSDVNLAVVNTKSGFKCQVKSIPGSEGTAFSSCSRLQCS